MLLATKCVLFWPIDLQLYLKLDVIVDSMPCDHSCCIHSHLPILFFTFWLCSSFIDVNLVVGHIDNLIQIRCFWTLVCVLNLIEIDGFCYAFATS